MKKVLFISTVLEQHIEAFHKPYIAWLRRHGCEVHVIANACGKPFDLCDKLYDVAIERSPYSLKNIPAFFKVRKIINKEKYDLITCHTPMGGVIARLAAKKARRNGTKVLYTAHGFNFYKGSPKSYWILYYTMEKFLAGKADCIITMNEEDYSLAKRKFESPKTEIKKIDGIGVDLERFSPVTEEEKVKLKEENGYGGKFLLIYAAEFIPRKNHKFLIDAAPVLCKKYPDIKFLFCGKGEIFEEIKAYAEEKGVSEYIDFLGFRKDMPNLYNMSDILSISSRQEGLPINLIEGMASGLPAVASAIRGQTDAVINGENGYLYSLDSPEEFIECVSRIHDDRELYKKMSAAAVESVKKFDIKNTLKQMEKIYREYKVI